MNAITTTRIPVIIPGSTRLKTPPEPCPYMTKNSCTALGSKTRQHAKHNQRTVADGFKILGADGTVVLRKFIPQAASMQHCTAFSSNILAHETALSMLSIMANTTNPPKCWPGRRVLRENEIKEALHRQTTAGIKFIANVRSIGGIGGFFGEGAMGSKSVIACFSKLQVTCFWTKGLIFF